MAHQAHVVLAVAPDGSVQEHRHPHGVGILAVIGELTLAGHTYPHALLLEIGVGRGKPYSQFLGGPRRRHFAGIARDTYSHIAPHLFRIMQELSDATVQRWKRTSTTLWRPTMRYVGSKLHEGGRFFTFDRGKRFSVSHDDSLLMGDLCWAHLMTMRQRIRKFANAIDGSLTCLRGNARKQFSEWLPLELAERMRTWGPYAVAALANAAAKKRHHRMIVEFIARALGNKEPVEFALAHAANRSGAHQRVGDLRVYDATGRWTRVNTSVRVFEVLPSPESKLLP